MALSQKFRLTPESVDILRYNIRPHFASLKKYYNERVAAFGQI